MAMSLSRLVRTWPELNIEGRADTAITEVVVDSRRCGPGSLFVAIEGSSADGHLFVPAAVAAGCAAVAVQADRRAMLPLDLAAGRPQALVTAPRTQPLPARLAREHAGRPDRGLRLVGVTGTNGKTTVTFLVQKVLERLVGPCGLLGTIRYEIGGLVRPAPLTTPDGPALYGLLADMVVAGCRAAAMEISSHALSQERVADLALDAAVLTNLSRDHLDYHADMADYLAAKARILELVRPGPLRDKAPGVVAINVGDAALASLDVAGLPTVRFAVNERAVTGRRPDLVVVASELDPQGTHLVLENRGRQVELQSPLVGRFNVENLTAALAGCLALDLPLDDVVAALAEVRQVPGRLERFALPCGGLAVVDYAHTPEALAAVLRTCGELTKGRLLVVFGCGGDRDQGKRPLMGAVAAREADLVWITSDNPRSEDPLAIIAAVTEGYLEVDHARAVEHCAVADRKQAIEAALATARPGDIVVVAGKGHEDYQLVAGMRLDLDDRAVVREWIARDEDHD